MIVILKDCPRKNGADTLKLKEISAWIKEHCQYHVCRRVFGGLFFPNDDPTTAIYIFEDKGDAEIFKLIWDK